MHLKLSVCQRDKSQFVEQLDKAEVVEFCGDIGRRSRDEKYLYFNES